LFGGRHRHRAVIREGNLAHQGRIGKVGLRGGVVTAGDGEQAVVAVGHADAVQRGRRCSFRSRVHWHRCKSRWLWLRRWSRRS
jgi:hypothetical protein